MVTRSKFDRRGDLIYHTTIHIQFFSGQGEETLGSKPCWCIKAKATPWREREHSKCKSKFRRDYE